MLFSGWSDIDASLHAALDPMYLADESSAIEPLLAASRLGVEAGRRVQDLARSLVETVRTVPRSSGSMDAFLLEYDLSSEEGVVLMCLAEALLRIPDAGTADRLIAEQLARGHWDRHLGHSQSLFVNASTWGLLLTGRLLRFGTSDHSGIDSLLQSLLRRGGEPLIRAALRQAMRILAEQFVLGRDIGEALQRTRDRANPDERFSFDMLGEAALTADDAERHFRRYAAAIEAVGRADRGLDRSRFEISVKLSALHPRFEFPQRERVIVELVPRLRELARHARQHELGLTVDAEETERLSLMLEVFGRVRADPALRTWDGLGLAVQAYQKRAPAVIDWLRAEAAGRRCRIPVRLVKGAYWDSEIKRAQLAGWPDFPVYTRKASTDVSYIACARRLFEASDRLDPRFATHNAQTVAVIVELAAGRAIEFQRLHGMGESLYQALRDGPDVAHACRVYAPVGGHEDLLPYLVRRLLENGANTSFVNRLEHARAPVLEVVADPVAVVAGLDAIRNPGIRLPGSLYPDRANSIGPNLYDLTMLRRLDEEVERALRRPLTAEPVAGAAHCDRPARPLHDPADQRSVTGHVIEADVEVMRTAVATAARAAADWAAEPVERRATALDRAAELLQARDGELIALCVREGGRCVADAAAELREAIDSCRYYAAGARQLLGRGQPLVGATGEFNEWRYRGRGVFACISPWNFPIAIFTGQVVAALVSGNTVVAKPAEATPLVAGLVVRVLHEAGIPNEVLQFVPGSGEALGQLLAEDPGIAGVAFTGSTETARAIQRALARRGGPIVPLIAETGGLNAMVADSSALPEQLVKDVVRSAFNSAGQRCSALRLLFVQNEIADTTERMLAGAIAELRVGDPMRLETDVGPLIDRAAVEDVVRHTRWLDGRGRLIHTAALGADARHGCFVAPVAYAIDDASLLDREVFGPVLHVIRYAADRLDAVVDAINATGYGLTFGVHSRIESRVRELFARVRAGNCYVNRDMIGAVVGVQPFGGEGLSGTGPKAGGPDYLRRFSVERSISINTAAVGGNVSLLEGDDR